MSTPENVLPLTAPDCAPLRPDEPETPGSGDSPPVSPAFPTLGGISRGYQSGYQSPPTARARLIPASDTGGYQSTPAFLDGPVGAFERYLWESRGGMWARLDEQGGVRGEAAP